MERYFVDLDQTQIHCCKGYIPKINLFGFVLSYFFFVQKTTNFTELLQQLILLINEAKLLISILELYS